MTVIKSTLALCAAALTLSACGGVRVTPDEFEVIDRAPLYVPPVSDLRPPRPGEPRAQAIDPGKMAFEALFPGKEFRRSKPLSNIEQAVVRKVGSAEPDVRTNAGEDEVEVVKKVLLLADILETENRMFRPDSVEIRRQYTDSINKADQDTVGRPPVIVKSNDTPS